VKDEDTDWLVYHLIAQGEEITPDALAAKAGLDGPALLASLDRLDRALLIQRSEGKVRTLSVGEALVRCQAKYDTTLPYVFEDGVIKPKKK